jgi:uncharacterized protein
MSEEKRREIARKGGEASGGPRPAESRDDRRLRDNLDPQTRREIGRKGGEAVSRNREHMSEIGRKGGEAVSRDREHMSQIGRKGGEARGG